MMVTMTLTMVEFLRARIAEDEAPGQLDHHLNPSILAPMKSVRARVLAECKARRAIVELHRLLRDPGGDPVHDECHECVTWPCPTLGHLAAVYAYHPDYNEEWRP